MGGPTGNAAVQNYINYKTIPNNTSSNWWQDPGKFYYLMSRRQAD